MITGTWASRGSCDEALLTILMTILSYKNTAAQIFEQRDLELGLPSTYQKTQVCIQNHLGTSGFRHLAFHIGKDH